MSLGWARRGGVAAMRISLVMAASLMMWPPLWAQTASAQIGPSTGTPQQPSTQVNPPVVATDADRLLKQMSVYIGSADQFTFHADITFDHVLPSGQKLQYAAREDVVLQRPGGLYVEWSGDLGNRQFWYDGKSVTLYDPATPFYATDATPGDIDAMGDKVV